VLLICSAPTRYAQDSLGRAPCACQVSRASSVIAARKLVDNRASAAPHAPRSAKRPCSAADLDVCPVSLPLVCIAERRQVTAARLYADPASDTEGKVTYSSTPMCEDTVPVTVVDERGGVEMLTILRPEDMHLKRVVYTAASAVARKVR
jgi:hypothetical protein